MSENAEFQTLRRYRFLAIFYIAPCPSLSLSLSFSLSLSLFEVGGKGSETTTSSTSSTLLWGMKLAAASPAMLNTPFFFFFFKNVYFIFFFFQRIIFFFFFWHFSTWIDDAKRKWLRFYDSLRSPLWDSLRFFEILWDSLRFFEILAEGYGGHFSAILPRLFTIRWRCPRFFKSFQGSDLKIT